MNILNPFFAVIHLIINIAIYIIIAQAIMSWLLAFGVMNLNNDIVRSLWTMLNLLTEPLYRHVRGIIPQINGIDLSPIVILVALNFISWFIPSGGSAFY